jgi:hypothetical protein
MRKVATATHTSLVPPSASDDLSVQLGLVRGEINELKGQLKRMKRRKKSSGVPQPINPYMFWGNVYQGGERKKVVADNGGPFNQTTNPNGISVSSAAKILGEKWRGLPQAARDTFKVLRDDYVKEKLLQEGSSVASVIATDDDAVTAA